MNSYLISGGNEQKRTNKINELIGKYSVSQFDQYILKPLLSIGITEVRELEHWLSLSPYQSNYKVAIIYSADKLTVEAQNALLKNLEEPSEKTIIVLDTQNYDRLLPTVISRCQVINLKSQGQIELNDSEVNEYLNYCQILFLGDNGEKFKLAMEVSKDREQVIDFLDKITLILEQLMTNKVSLPSIFPSIPTSFYPSLIRKFQQAKVYISANVNSRLVIENLFYL